MHNRTARSLSIETRRWRLKEPFVVSRGAQTTADVVIVRLRDREGRTGWGESCGVHYAGETLVSMSAELEGRRSEIESGITRSELMRVMAAGGARAALDAALWDLEAQQTGRSVFELANATAASVLSTYTIGIRTIEDYETTARAHANFPLLKVKVKGDGALDAVAAVRRGAPNARLIIDPNQSWDAETLAALAPDLACLGAVLIEQPIAAGREADLEGYRSPVPLCADESLNGEDDLPAVFGRFEVINIKLEKAGGLTAALALADAGEAMGFKLMVGCMAGSSLAMAPGLVLAQRCAFVDLDGPLLQAEDWPNGLNYRDGVIDPPAPGFWGAWP
jgi:L-Ala-D/L-Glu epimerase